VKESLVPIGQEARWPQSSNEHSGKEKKNLAPWGIQLWFSGLSSSIHSLVMMPNKLHGSCKDDYILHMKSHYLITECSTFITYSMYQLHHKDLFQFGVHLYYLTESIRTPTPNCNPTLPVTYFPVVDINTGWAHPLLYDSSNSAGETSYQVSECLWWNGIPFFLYSCSQSS
jgi:hypothetical protein